MKYIKTLCLLVAIIFSIIGCGWITYRIDIDQGNVIDKQTLSRIAIGMSKEEVQLTIGTPLLIDVFHNDRWDYIQYYKSGRLQKIQKGRVSLFFKNNLLINIKADSIADIKTEELPYSILNKTGS